MRITVIGTGYVGLVSGVCLASKGHRVTCVDLRREVVDSLNNGVPTIHEKGLPGLLAEVIAGGRFNASHSLEESLSEAEAVIVAVGTPSSDGMIDLSAIAECARQIGGFMKKAKRPFPVIIKSTVLPGTTDTLVQGILEETSGYRLGGDGFGLGMNPEFLREGEAIDDFMNPDRIVLGFEDPAALAALRQLYSPWDCQKVEVNTRTAEMIKYANNCLLAIQISAANELANLASRLGGIDFMDVLEGVQSDKRWNPILPSGERASPAILTYHVPGCGFGGSCFPKDVQAIRTQGKDLGLPMRLLQSVLDINDEQPSQVVEALLREMQSGQKPVEAAGARGASKVLVLGLAFKPGTDDVRESASFKMIRELRDNRIEVMAHDPIAIEQAIRAYPWIRSEVALLADWKAGLESASAVVIATSWPEYRELCGDGLKDKLKGKVILDARRLFKPGEFPEAEYMTVGGA